MLMVANWKMKLPSAAMVEVAKALTRDLRRLPATVEVVLCPGYLSLGSVADVLRGTTLHLGAQDCFWESQGAYTGEVPADDLRGFDCEYVILGHSERRQHLGETDEQVHRKLQAALRVGLTPILCIGEDYQQRAGNQKDYVLIRQLQTALEGTALPPHQRLVVAYEPVWAISTGGIGIEATPEEVGYAAEVIRHIIIDVYGPMAFQEQVCIIYGGSVNAQNVASFTQLPNISGVLVGAASLKAEEFAQVIHAAAGSSGQQ